MRRSHLLLVPAAFLLATAVHAGVIVVDASGAGSFTDLPAAVAAAVDGDVLLVKSGVYSGFTISNEALDVVADVGAVVRVDGRVIVQNVALARSVTLVGLEVRAPAAQQALLVTGCAVSVRVQGCTLVGGDAVDCLGTPTGGDGATVGSSGDVAIERSTLLGGKGAESGEEAWDGGRGLGVASSSVAVHDCTLRGGHGGDWGDRCFGYGFGYAGAGGAGFWVTGTTVSLAAGCAIEGGSGGDALSSGATNGPGASAFVSLGVAPDPRALDSTFVSGASGVGPYTYPPSPPIGTTGGPFTMFPGTARHVTATRVVRELHAARIDVTGTPGETVELRFGEDGRFKLADHERGVSLIARRPPRPVMLAGTIPGSGVLTIGWSLPDLGPGIDSQRVFVQATCVDTSTGQRTLSGVATMVFLDSAY